MNTRFGSRTACSAIHWSFVDTVGKLKVSPVFPSSETSYLISPSLPWVPWVSVPHVLRYYSRLRLPTVHSGRFARRSLPAPCCCPFGLYPLFKARSPWGNARPAPGPCGKPVAPAPAVYGREVVGSPKFPSCPYAYMPRSYRPRWCPLLLAMTPERTAAFRYMHYVGFLFPRVEDYPHRPQLYVFRGSISRPARLLHPAPYSPLLDCTRVRYGPVGSTLVRSDLPCYCLWRTD